MTTTLPGITVGLAALVLHAGLAAAAAAKVPDACQQPHLSQELQRFCDQLQFADVPHYHVVRLADNGAVRSLRLIETATGREVITSYPYGVTFAIPDQSDRELRIRPEELEGALEGRPTPAPVAAAPAGFATGLPIGWNSSTGPTSGQCLNYTIAQPSTHVEQASFSSEHAAHSTAEQIHASATVNVAFDLFQASDTFSFSDEWQSSTNSGNQYFNVYSLYTLNSTVPRENPLNDQGQERQADGNFETLCGTEYLAAVPAGMLVTISIDYGSASSSTETAISNEFSATSGLNSLTLAVDAVKKAQDVSSYFSVTMTHYGGGTAASTALNNAFTATDDKGRSFYALCQQLDPEACTHFTSSMGHGALEALSAFDQQVDALSGATNPDLSFLQLFPSGVAGAITPAAVTSPIPVPQRSDVLLPYKAHLEDYVTLVNQLATLNNRVTLLRGLFKKVPTFNPVHLLDLGSYLDRLQQTYTHDRTHLLANLKNCLQATDDNVTMVCQPIIDNQAPTVFEYYHPGGPGNDFFAQQNTLALQYTAEEQLFHPPQHFPPTPMDVIYIDELPSFSQQPHIAPIAGEAAFVGFADRPVPLAAGGVITDAQVTILPLDPGKPLSTNHVSPKARANPDGPPSPFTFWSFRDASGRGSLLFWDIPPGSTFTSTGCTPTFARPCAINYVSPEAGGFTTAVAHHPLTDLFTAD